MKNIGEFSSDGYGMAIISTDLITSYLRDNKIKAKKLLSYFDKHKDLLFETIKAGRFLPFYNIACYEYTLFISVDQEEVNIPEDYNEVFRYTDFYLEVGNLERVCFASFDYLEYHLDKIKQNMTDKEDLIPTGPDSIIESYYPAKGIDLPKGIYSFDLIGLERKNKLQRDSKNYGYAFIFHNNKEAINNNFDKADNETYCFDIDNYKEY
jgi:hypothetical protein